MMEKLIIEGGNRKLNILIILHWMKADGSGIYYSRLARKLSERGHSVIVASTGGPLVKDLEDNRIVHYKLPVLDLGYTSVYMRTFEIMSSIKSGIDKKFNVVSEVEGNFGLTANTKMTFAKLLRYPSKITLFFLLWLFSVIKLLIVVKREKIDVIDSHSTGGIALAFCCFKITKIPFLATITTPSFVGLPKAMFRSISQTASGIIALSQECVNYLTSDFEWKRKIEIIHNVVDLYRFRPLSEAEKTSYKQSLIERGFQINSGHTKIAVVSRVDEDKEDSVVSVIRAMPEIIKSFPGVQLIVAGDGNIFGRVNQLADNINSKLGEPAIIMIGYEKHVEKVINLADVVIGVGAVAIEAMACSKPMIVAGHRRGPGGGSFGGIITPDSLKELRDYYFTGRNSSQKTAPLLITQACQKLLSDEALREKLGEFGRRFVMEECNIEKSVTTIERMFFEAIAH